jgi:hypothetical protein
MPIQGTHETLHPKAGKHSFLFSDLSLAGDELRPTLRIMNIELLTRSLALLFVATIVGLCEEASDQQRSTFPKWSFCVAYQVRDPDERDARPVAPNAEKDPFNDWDTRIPHGLINDCNIVDVAALINRLVKSEVLKRDAAEGLLRGITNGTKRHPIADCYKPHHLFVFYGYEGHPLAAIEVCFSCNRVKMTPEVRVGRGAIGPFESADLAGLAKIATEAGLDLNPYASLDAYVQRLDQLTERRNEKAKHQDANGNRRERPSYISDFNFAAATARSPVR